MYSGTMDSIVYDTVLEETGDSGAFEQRIGRVRVIESIALVASSLLGGWVANLTTTRLTYFLIITLAVLTSVILQLVFEFGPLWLVALAVAAILYGPYWACLVSTIGLGGLLAGRLRFERPATLAAVVAVMTLCTVVLTTTTDVLVVTIAQVILALLIVATSIHVTRLLHDAVPSTVRSGVASGVGAISWMVFLPVALAFGVVSNHHGVHTAGWMLTATTMLSGLLLAAVVRGQTAADSSTLT